jgi:hypothetical protein
MLAARSIGSYLLECLSTSVRKITGRTSRRCTIY